METVVIKELLPHVDSNFRTIASRRGRVVEGFSMGGYGAARFGIKFHEVFGAASVLAGGPFHPDFGHAPAVGPEGRERVLQRVFGGDIEYYAALSPARLAEQYADAVRGSLLLRIVVGNLDVTAQLNREFSTHLTALDIPHTFTEVPDVGHQTMPLLRALGDDNWAFYRAAMDGIAEDVNPAP
jgi:enterochelin esterase-like enzyme